MRRLLKESRFKSEMTDVLICPDGETWIHMLINDGLGVVIVITRKGMRIRKYKGHDPVKEALELLQDGQ